MQADNLVKFLTKDFDCIGKDLAGASVLSLWCLDALESMSFVYSSTHADFL